MKIEYQNAAELDAIEVKRALDGNKVAFEVLVKRYRNLIYTLAYRVLDDVQDAEDVKQNVFVIA